MNKKTLGIDPLYGFLHTEVEGVEALAKLALDIRWSWNHAADEIWQQLDPSLWEMTRNPWIILQTVSKEQLKQKLMDAEFRQKLDKLIQQSEATKDSITWFQENHSDTPLSCVAYFSMEYMLTEGLPIYSGGLGNVAGDQLKAANDMGVPIVAVGLLYQQGYFRQVIGKDGSQEEYYPYNDPGQLPIMPLRKPNGEWLRLEISFPGYSVWLRTWEVQIGNVRLYLLDSNDVANFPPHRGITSELYGGGPELRLQQEIILGIGGWRLLRELNIKPEVCHLNEGHAAFAILERTKDFMKLTGLPFETALSVTRTGNLFTTHTAVPAGFDRFEPNLVAHYLSNYALNDLGISIDDLLTLGRINPYDNSEPFNMAYLAIHGSGAINGVSRLHGIKSRELFRPLFPRWPEEEIPVGYVTNGVHMRSWDSKAADDLWTEACGKDRWMGTGEGLHEHLKDVTDGRLWEMRTAARKDFIDFIRKRLPNIIEASGGTVEEAQGAKELFDPNTFTLGFARRFATYKRPNLLLHDKERLLRILTNPAKPVQIALAGKAHPEDMAGQALIQEWVNFSRIPEARSHVVFLSDYDMFLTEQMVQGVDVWLNTPRRPWEASGTSGMKALVNGVINFSELDGWWDEAYTPDVGWALGDRQEHGDSPEWDVQEANQLYHLLESEIVPAFYERNENGIPLLWTAKMRNSMAKLTPQFSTNRTLKDYTEQYYIPAAKAYKIRSATNGKAGLQIINHRQILRENWECIHFGNLQVDEVEMGYHFQVQVFMKDVAQKDVLVELYANGLDSAKPERVKMETASSQNNNDEYLYQATVETARNRTDFTVRIIPNYEGVSVPLEDNLIRWQH
ncbi:starch phosphorylase [Pedobacter sp. UYEF25]